MIYVLHHAGCPDGFGSAWAAFNRLSFDAQYIPVQYGDPIPEQIKPGDVVFMVDVTFDRPTTEKLAELLGETKVAGLPYPALTILDHHKSAAEALQGLPYAHFDMRKSGAVLAWEYFHNSPPPELLRYVQDRDLWRWEERNTKEVLAYLDSFPFDFQVWRDVHMELVTHRARVVEKGAQIVRYKEQAQQRLLENAQWINMTGHRIPAINTPIHQSELGNMLCKLHPEAAFSASYYDNKDGVRLWSLRSVGEFDVSAVAKQYGGGGHRNAAGFRQMDPPSTWTEPSQATGSRRS